MKRGDHGADGRITYRPIGYARTPYRPGSDTPYQPVHAVAEPDAFYIELRGEWAPALVEMERLAYLYVLAHVDRLEGAPEPLVRPPWHADRRVGLFASRSPRRPNPIALSVVRLLRISGTRLYTSCMDLFDGTPVLDIKPYLLTLDSKPDANDGWLEGETDREHLALHLAGIPHEDADHA